MTATILLRIGRNCPAIVGAANVEGVSTGRGGCYQGGTRAGIVQSDRERVAIVICIAAIIDC